MRLAVIVLLAACGRVGFEPRKDAAVLADDARPDAMPDATSVVTGCADGEREGFADMVAFPSIAACTATWMGTPSLRDAKTGASCGDDIGLCASPADACSVDWHVCVDTGDITDLTARVSASECATAGNAAIGQFVGAAEHCSGCMGSCMGGEADCIYASTYTCDVVFNSCGEPICCGPDCSGIANCRGGFFPAPGTLIGAIQQPCGALPDNAKTGVLCCAD